jgi:hypothetical protein
MQAIDIITALEAVKIILNENNLEFNSNRVIGYGHSHGAYLLHLSNILASHLFSFIIDNSAWVEPKYLVLNRIVYQRTGTSTLCVEFDYLARKLIRNKRDLSLYALYNTNVSNNAQILTYQGNQDVLIDHTEKEKIICSLKDAKFILVSENDIDNELLNL